MMDAAYALVQGIAMTATLATVQKAALLALAYWVHH
jgi:hypothetical protein